MIEIDSSRYAKVKRGTALAILEQAQIKPDKFTAHRNKTFTARYLRSRQTEFDIGRLEAIDHRVVVLKNPSKKLDRGRYITFKFAMAEPEQLGIKIEPPTIKQATENKTTQINENVLNLVNSVARNMQQLANFAHELASTDDKHDHLILTIEELQSQAKLLHDSLQHVLDQKKTG